MRRSKPFILTGVIVLSVVAGLLDPIAVSAQPEPNSARARLNQALYARALEHCFATAKLSSTDEKSKKQHITSDDAYDGAWFFREEVEDPTNAEDDEDGENAPSQEPGTEDGAPGQVTVPGGQNSQESQTPGQQPGGQTPPGGQQQTDGQTPPGGQASPGGQNQGGDKKKISGTLYYAAENDGRKCGESGWAHRAVNVLRFANGPSALDSFGFTIDRNLGMLPPGTPAAASGKVMSGIQRSGVGRTPNFDAPEVKYLLYNSLFFGRLGCNARDPNKPDDEEQIKGDKGAKVNVVIGGELTKDALYVFDGKTGKDKVVLYNKGKDNESATCNEVAKQMSANAQAYADYMAANPDERDTAKVSAGAVGNQRKKGESDCNIDWLGWAVCPLMNFASKINDQAYHFLKDYFLEVPTSLYDTNSTTYKVWTEFLSYANALFVIFFLIMIYSQTTSAKIEAYGVRKLLPRIIIAAMLVNFSFVICQIGVDISNMLGHTLRTTISGNQIFDSMGLTGQDTWSWGEVLGGILAVGTATFMMIALGFGVVFFGLLAMLLIMFILVAREVAIVFLISVSPLAFAMYLLPNTVKIFHRWRKAFTAVLLVYPIVTVVYGASQLAGGILSEMSTSKPEYSLIALAATVMPLFVVPSLLMKSLKGLENIGMGKLSDAAARAASRAASRSAAMYRSNMAERYGNSTFALAVGTGKAARDSAARTRFAKRAEKDNWIGAATRGAAGITGGKEGREAALRYAQAQSEKDYDEDEGAYLAMWGVRDYDMVNKIANGTAPAKSDAERSAAIKYITKHGDMHDMAKIFAQTGDMIDKKQLHALSAAVAGARQSGLTELTGTAALGQASQGLVRGEVNAEPPTQEQINEGKAPKSVQDLIAENAAGGKIGPKAVGQSESATEYVEEMVQSGKFSSKAIQNLDNSMRDAVKDPKNNLTEKSKQSFQTVHAKAKELRESSGEEANTAGDAGKPRGRDNRSESRKAIDEAVLEARQKHGSRPPGPSQQRDPDDFSI